MDTVLTPRSALATRIVTKLQEKQAGLEFNDTTFASYLDVDRVLWIKTSNGTRPLALTIATAAYRKFPDLSSMVLDFLLTSKVRSRSGEVRTRRAVRPQTSRGNTE